MSAYASNGATWWASSAPTARARTTLLRLLAGMLRPESEPVTLNGRNSRRWRVPRSRVRLPSCRRRPTSRSINLGARDRADGALSASRTFEPRGPARCGHPRVRRWRPPARFALERRSFATLSGGEKQRVVIASALAQQGRDSCCSTNQPASLDLGYQFDIAALLARLNREREITIVVATPRLEFRRQPLPVRSSCSPKAASSRRTHQATTLTSMSIQALYGVVADVYPHHAAGPLNGGAAEEVAA